MSDPTRTAIALVGVGAVMPDAPDAPTFWKNLTEGRYSISETPRERWDPAAYFDPDPKAPAKSYSKIGGWVRDYPWDPIAWKLPIPPRVAAAMDRTQQWGVVAAREALLDYGYPQRPLDRERTAVVMGNAMGGDRHYVTALRVLSPEIAAELEASPAFRALDRPARTAILAELERGVARRLPEITEDTMPGELSNIIAGRIANLFDLHGPNFVCDAACASTMAAVSAAIAGLDEGAFDAVITGGIDANMSASTFVKFCKIGALSATGSRPYADGADGFVMGEGAAVFLLKRLADAERDGDRVYAVLRGMGGASDGRGKGITAPNPKGQRLAVERAWLAAGLSPATVGYVEGHGTSTAVGDLVELESLSAVFAGAGAAPGSLPLGSVKSNIGHLKGAAGAAGLLKAALALHHKVIPPSLNCERPNRGVDFTRVPFRVATSLAPFAAGRHGEARRSCVSAFGFGGTNFHAVLEEWIPGRLTSELARRSSVAVSGAGPALATGAAIALSGSVEPAAKRPLRGALLLGADDEHELAQRLRGVRDAAANGSALSSTPPTPPDAADLARPLRLAIDFSSPAELAKRCDKALHALETGRPGAWRVLRAQGVVRWQGEPAKVAFLYTGQGSQYVNMLDELRRSEPIVAETFAEADRVMTPLFGRPLTEIVFAPESDSARFAASEEALRQTQYTQPAVLAVDVALTRLLAAYGVTPDFVMGHSLGEYGALVAAGSLSFAEALEAVSARGREMTRLSVGDPGKMAAVFAPLPEIEAVLGEVEGYVVVANLNSTAQAVIGGESAAVERAVEAFSRHGREVRYLPVSHAFHTRIVAPASEPLRRMLTRLRLAPPRVPLISNATGRFYPMAPDAVPEMIDLLGRQIAEPVQFVQGLMTLYDAGARVFVEIGPKRALQGFVEDVLGDRPEVMSLATNHPKLGDAGSLNLALCGLYAAGRGTPRPAPAASPMLLSPDPTPVSVTTPSATPEPRPLTPATGSVASSALPGGDSRMSTLPPVPPDRYSDLGRLFVDFLSRGLALASGEPLPHRLQAADEGVVVTGAALGLPGAERVFDDGNLARLLAGDQLLDAVPMRLRQAMVARRITRLVKSEAGGPRFEPIESEDEVIKLAARAGELEFGRDFGFSEERTAAFDRTTMLAIGAGIDALRDAGIPLVMRYKTTTTGGRLPDRWGLPEELRDGTGVIFGSAFPGYDQLVGQMERYHRDLARRQQLTALESLRAPLAPGEVIAAELDRRIALLRQELEREPFSFDRRFLFQVLSMGHSQFAEAIGARGPNTAINSACATTTQAFALASDWIHAGRCDRVIVIAADDITSDNLLAWFGSGFLASGAAATDERVEDAALPFDRRRHGLLIGMGAAAAVIERAGAARARGLAPICEVLSTVTANSAFHGSRLDVSHIGQVMERLVADAEARWGIDRHAIAPELVFVSHETYTPARGGSAQAEVDALRRVFGASTDRIVIANTKGYTGHPMAVGIEDVMAVKSLETGIVPPVPNIREIDPDLGALNISRGGSYPIRYALRLGAGFGSQVSMTLLRWTPAPDGRRRSPAELGFAYRVADRGAWDAFLSRASGNPQPALEVVHRTLRIADPGSVRFGAASGTAAVQQRQSKDFQAGERQDTAPLATGTRLDAPHLSSSSEAKDLGGGAHAEDAVTSQVLELIAEKTGYPREMLALDLDLEADLGIDTVKQAEVFAAIRERYGIERDPHLKLRDFPTIARTIQFVYDHRPELRVEQRPEKTTAAAPAPPQPSGAAVSSPTQQAFASSLPPTQLEPEDEVTATVLALVAEKTGYPREMLALDLDLEADLGVDTVKQAELFAAVRERYEIERDPNLKLRDFPTLARTIEFVYDHRPELRPVLRQTLRPELPVEGTATAALAPPQPSGSANSSSTQQVLPLSLPPTHLEPEDEVTATVLALVAEKTGYPREMLDLDLDLEADLGVDTVKQAELFAAVRERYAIERDPNLKLRDFPTLARTIEFVYDHRPELRPAVSSVGEGFRPQILRSAQDDNTGRSQEDNGGTQHLSSWSEAKDLGGNARAEDEVIAAAPSTAICRRTPVAVLRPALALCAPTGVELGAGRRVLIAPDRGGVAAPLSAQLRSLGVEVHELDAATPLEAIAARASELAGGGVDGLFWLPALDDEGALASLDLESFRAATHLRVKAFAATLRALYESLGRSGAFVVAATRLGGRHGVETGGASSPLGGAVTGLTKTFARERPEALVKAVDFELSADPSAIAEGLLDETLSDPGAVEIGHASGMRFTVALDETPLLEEPSSPTERSFVLGRESVSVVTGAAGSIVAAIVRDLARHGGSFHLLDLAPEPDPTDADLVRFTTDRDGLKLDLFARLSASGERATPARIEKELARLERQRAALDAIEAIRAAGGRATYHRVDLRDGAAVAAAVGAALGESGRIDLLLHAAGLEISRLLPDKSDEELALVFDVKADGAFNLLRALGDAPLGALVTFGSIAGRFGNGGQADYAAANDFLAKLVSHLAATRPGTRGLALDWTGWAGIGMASRGSIPKLLEAAGIDLLPPSLGIPVVRRELAAGAPSRELVLAGRLGGMFAERAALGGVQPSAIEQLAPGGPMSGTVAGCSLHGGLTLEVRLDPVEQPFLDDHRIDGTAVLPGVMGIEAFAEAARTLFPDRRVAAVEEMEFLAPFKLYRDEPRSLEVLARFRSEGDEIVADCRLVGKRTLPGHSEPQATTHFRGRVRLAAPGAAAAVRNADALPVAGAEVDREAIYRVYFHGPAYQVIGRAFRAGEVVVGELASPLPPNHRPAELATEMEPRWIELAFQTAGLEQLGRQGTLGLPHRLRRVALCARPEPGTALAALARRAADGTAAVELVDAAGRVLLEVEGYATVELPGAAAPEDLEPIRRALAPQPELEKVR